MKNFSQVIQTLIETNDKLISKEISIEVAKQVASNTQTIINGARLQLDLMKFCNKKDSIFFEELEPIDKTLDEIEKNRKQPIRLG
jgi:hypothetical protein